jgi:hypothetical protein
MHYLDPATKTSTHLAKRHNRAGIAQEAQVCHAAFAGCINMAVPRFPNGVRSDGTTIRGLASHLEPAVGTAAGFGAAEGCYSTLTTFLASGLSHAEGFERSWELMRTETGADPAGVFSAAAADAPGEPRAEDREEGDGHRLRLQRTCTRERQRTLLGVVNTRMAELRGNGPMRMAWNYSSSGEHRRATRSSSPERLHTPCQPRTMHVATSALPVVLSVGGFQITK